MCVGRWFFALLSLLAVRAFAFSLVQGTDGSLRSRSPVDMGANTIYNVRGGSRRVVVLGSGELCVRNTV